MSNSTLFLNLIVLLLLVVVVRNGPSKLHVEEDELINLPPGTTPYNILAAVFCLRGHFNPASGHAVVLKFQFNPCGLSILSFKSLHTCPKKVLTQVEVPDGQSVRQDRTRRKVPRLSCVHFECRDFRAFVIRLL